MRATPHCPNCHFPLFAHPFDAKAAPTPAPVFPESHIMIGNNVLGDPHALITVAEQSDAWRPSAIAEGDGARYGAGRSNDFLFVCGDAEARFAPFETALTAAFHGAASSYSAMLGHLSLRSDLGYQLLRYRPGEEFTEHVDILPGATVYGQRLVSAIAYLNDDYDGGELRFPRQGFTYNPLAGSLILFPSNFCYPHASLPVRRGIKYAVVTWFI